MTTLDELKLMWEAQDRKLDMSLRLNQQLLRAGKLNRVRVPLRGLMFELGIEIAASAAGLVLLGNFLAAHITEARYIWPAALLEGWLILCLVASIRQVLMAKAIEYDGPVNAIQGQLGELRVLRLRILRMELLTGQIVWWIPFLIVGLKLLFGVDAYRFLGTGFIVVNMMFGVAVIPLAIWMARSFGERIERSAFMRRLADEVAGKALREAQKEVAKLAEFEKG